MIDSNRHQTEFNPLAFGSRRVDVIGAGATGSKVVLSLAKLGIEVIHVWDFDRVEPHNIANQAFGNGDIGKLKVEALAELVRHQTGTQIVCHDEKVDGSQELGNVVFLLTDTMASREEIWRKGIRFKQRTKVMIETRMGVDNGRVYTINPCKGSEAEGWEGTLCSDDVAQVSACGTSISVGPTSGFLAELAVWQLMRWFAIDQGKGGEDELDHEIMFYLRKPLMMIRRFDD